MNRYFALRTGATRNWENVRSINEQRTRLNFKETNTGVQCATRLWECCNVKWPDHRLIYDTCLYIVGVSPVHARHRCRARPFRNDTRRGVRHERAGRRERVTQTIRRFPRNTALRSSTGERHLLTLRFTDDGSVTCHDVCSIGDFSPIRAEPPARDSHWPTLRTVPGPTNIYRATANVVRYSTRANRRNVSKSVTSLIYIYIYISFVYLDQFATPEYRTGRPTGTAVRLGRIPRIRRTTSDTPIRPNGGAPTTRRPSAKSAACPTGV